MEQYSFVTRWSFPAPCSNVWDEISHSLDWPQWWRGVEAVIELEAGDDDGLGSLRRYTWKSALPYRLKFDMRTVRVERCIAIEGIAMGELEGRGLWTFEESGGVTSVRYDWDVKTTKAWMRILAPIARPLFNWNHDVIMKWGYEGLTRRLESRSSKEQERVEVKHG